MRITLVSNMYDPEQYASAPLNTQAAEYLAAQGHEVTVLTSFPHYPEWSVWPGWRGHLWTNKSEGSIRLRRIRSYVPSKPKTVGRVLHYASFAAASMVGFAGLPRPDVILCVTPPIELAYPGSIWSRRLGAKLVLWVKDLVPEIAIQLGQLRNPSAIWLARKLERRAYRIADRIIVICDGFRDYITRTPSLTAPIDVVPDWVDPTAFQVSEDPEAIRHRYGLPLDAFVAVHSGNMGQKQGLETLLQTAAQLDTQENTIVLLVGDGSERQRLFELARSAGLRSLRFVPMLPREEFPKLLSVADVLLVHQKSQAAETVIPSKLLSYMASGKPILAGVNDMSETARTLRATKAGLVVPPEDSTSFRTALAHLRHEPAERRALGEAGKQAVATRFARNVVLHKLENILKETLGDRRTGTSLPA